MTTKKYLVMPVLINKEDVTTNIWRDQEEDIFKKIVTELRRLR